MRRASVLALILVPALLLSIVAVRAGVDSGPASSGPRFSTLMEQKVFNGIDPKKYEKFWEKWPILTARYRTDNGEQRMVWANSIAWKAIRGHQKTYPEGSVFAKIAFSMEKDSAFPNSLVPAETVRVQIMKKDSARYPETGGWGYAIFPNITGGKQTEKAMVTACAACHLMVKNRNYVFSVPAVDLPMIDEGEVKADFAKRFVTLDYSALNDFEKRAVASVTTLVPEKVRIVHLTSFDGSLHESSGPLSGYVSREGMPYVLSDEQHGQYLAGAPNAEKGSCKSRVRLGYRVIEHVVVAQERPHTEERVMVQFGNSCDGKITWDGTMQSQIGSP